MIRNKTIIFDIETANAVTRTGQGILRDACEYLAYNTMDIVSTGKNTMTLKVLKNRYYGATDRTFWAPNNLCKEIMFPEPSTSKYKFSRAKWHTAEIGDGYWRLGREYNEIIAWCNETFGLHPKKPDAWSRWWVGIGQIYFRDEQDLVLYKLKWS